MGGCFIVELGRKIFCASIYQVICHLRLIKTCVVDFLSLQFQFFSQLFFRVVMERGQSSYFLQEMVEFLVTAAHSMAT